MLGVNDGTRSDTCSSGADDKPSEERKACCLALRFRVQEDVRFSTFVKEVWNMGLYQKEEAMERFLMSEVADFVAIEWPKRCAYWGWNQWDVP